MLHSVRQGIHRHRPMRARSSDREEDAIDAIVRLDQIVSKALSVQRDVAAGFSSVPDHEQSRQNSNADLYRAWCRRFRPQLEQLP